ncbi:alkaline phosphatase family protein [Robiginitalea sp.]|uniref:alkaline phosphatase family protein n=1 Tax=Robiginitalea sp. TaxID=1902411 RepID=UPI003C7538B5
MNTYLINRFAANSSYGLWKFDPNGAEIFTQVQIDRSAAFDPSYRMISIGNYILTWGPKTISNGAGQYPYALMEFDPLSSNPLEGKVIQRGNWPVSKFYQYWSKYSADPTEQNELTLLPMGTFVLFFVGAENRGTYSLFNFDPNILNPNTTDPLIASDVQVGSVAFQSIQGGHRLIPFNNHVLDQNPDETTYRIWSFDPQDNCPLSIPAVAKGTWQSVQIGNQFTALGDYILSWSPTDLSYTLYLPDPAAADPFSEIISQGSLPVEMSGSSSMFGLQTRNSVLLNTNPQPGTIEFMQSKIKHVVYYMLESRSFDNVCGWLYENDQSPINFIGSDAPFNGASTKNSNWFNGQQIFQSKFMGGKLSQDYDLNDQSADPFHSVADTLSQMYKDGFEGYKNDGTPDMSGFVSNNANPDVMLTLTPEQLPVLNGLASNYAISDEWFSAVSGGTTMNRAFSVTGSAMDKLYSWEGGSVYTDWAKYLHRQSIWKVLYSNGIKDFKIYNAMIWMNYAYTYHLFLEGQVPSIDNAVSLAKANGTPSPFTGTLDQFKADAANGTLPAFSFLEPFWIAPSGTTSYHPKADLVPGEMALNSIYEALKNSPKWNETLFVITFSKGGGIYDHAIPPKGEKAWPNDCVNDFHYDQLGQRVPAIFVSPWIKKNTVIRSGQQGNPFDGTSFAATLLKWFGIPKGKWALGERMAGIPTIESLFQETAARHDAPTLPNPYDKSHPQAFWKL